MKKTIILGAACLMATTSAISWAQTNRSQAWRCPGNYYTNDSQEARSLGGCERVGDRITVIHENRSRGGGTPRPQAGGNTPRPAPQANMQIDPSAQNRRDNDARTLLEMELSHKQNELTLLQSQFNNGQPERLASEVDNDASYEARVERLRSEIERKLADISSIQNELDRHTR